MLGNRRRDTQPEVALRRAIHRRGLRYRVDFPMPTNRRRRIDIAFTRVKLAVFVDGCFWHGCPQHATQPSTNSNYWMDKIAGNRARDAHTNQQLGTAGWIVMRFWEHDDPDEAAELIYTEYRDQAEQLNIRVVTAGRPTL